MEVRPVKAKRLQGDEDMSFLLTSPFMTAGLAIVRQPGGAASHQGAKLSERRFGAALACVRNSDSRLNSGS
jgi:hypothetical protein